MKQLLEMRIAGFALGREEAKTALNHIFTRKYSELQATAFIMTYCMKPPTAPELTGFRDALLAHNLSLNLAEFNAIDVCGTGGDGKNTFNISTLVAFVLAAGGEKVIKHGNYAVSSKCGSSNVLEFLGYTFHQDEKILSQHLEKHNFCYLHAPLFNPVMKNVSHIRKHLGVKTFFNLLGPLVNPASPKKQLIGVANLETFDLYREVFKNEDINFAIISSLDGYDEVSLTANTKYATNSQCFTLSPASFNLTKQNPKDLFGGNNVKEASEIFVKILQGEGTPAQNEVISANAAVAFQLFYPEKNLKELAAKAKEILLSGKGYKLLKDVLL